MHPGISRLSDQPAVRAKGSPIDQTFMVAEILRALRRAEFAQILGRCGQMIILLAENAGVKSRVRQGADTKNQIGGVPVRIDKIIGQRQLNVEPGIARGEPGKPRRDVPLAKKTGPLMRIVPDGSLARSSSSRRASSRLPVIARA